MRKFKELLTFLSGIFAAKRMPTNRELFYTMALSVVGTDASPNDLAPDELGCAESVDGIYFRLFKKHICDNFLSTYWMYKALKEKPEFIRVLDKDVLPGDIVISPTQGANTGHVGIVGQNGIIMSNNSFKDSNGVKGIFDENYTLASWRRYFFEKKGLGLHYFRVV